MRSIIGSHLSSVNKLNEYNKLMDLNFLNHLKTQIYPTMLTLNHLSNIYNIQTKT